ncbi:MAG: nucleotide sugar dehydrogenase [Geminicoccaceae bacterium]
MKVSVFGLGYVGLVTAACLARDGHEVVGVDVAQSKVDAVKDGKSPIVEDQVEDLLTGAAREGRLTATTSAAEAVAGTEMAIVCVGTPSRANGTLDTRHVEQVAAEIGHELRHRDGPFLFVLRSTVLPGTVRNVVTPVLQEAAGRPVGEGYDIVFHPEFLRESTAVADYDAPPKIVVGERVPGAGKAVFDLYEGIEAPRFAPSLEVAEAVKYADNAFHAVKVTFANECGRLFARLGADSREVMDIFCKDTKLNISPYYLKPGFAFGGSCLPKDVRAIVGAARYSDLALPMLESVIPSNERQIDTVARMVVDRARAERAKVGLVGLAFKPKTDDLRESPLVELAERLRGKGVHVTILDPAVQEARLFGANRAYIEEHIPHLTKLMVQDALGLDGCGVIVIGHATDAAQLIAWMEAGKTVIDLVGRDRNLIREQPELADRYIGIAW